MIETEQTITIDAPIATVWTYARNINGWAGLMPGLQACDVLDEDDSRWTLKVGAGALVRRVTVFVHVDRWAGPEEVDFTFRLEGDPVKGGGTFRARAADASHTEVTLGVRVEGTGPMAPMWEAMGKPLLPKFARGFAEEFKAEIEQHSALTAQDRTPHLPPLLARLAAWLRRIFGQNPTGKDAA